VLATTVLHGLAIQTVDLTTNFEGRGASNIGLLVIDSSGLRLSDTAVVAGKAGAGVAGDDGAPTTLAHNGGGATEQEPGEASSLCSQACTVQVAFQVDEQGDNRCGFGGAYWPSTTTSPYPAAISPRTGNPGTSDDTVLGGKAGVTSYDNSSCSLPDAQPGFPGADGENGPRGNDGAPSARASVTDEGVIEPDIGEDGGAGVRGSWGGGGGGGGSFMDGCTNDPIPGKAGGGGGAPGCGGDFGRGGGGGGVSIGVLAIASSGFSLSSDSSVTSGDAGSGGDGGVGSEGGKGGVGASNQCPSGSSNAACGGNGGPGGDGGRGGHGGAGAGGDSVAVYCIDTEIALDQVTLTSGAPGSGGEGAASPQDGESGEALSSVGCDA
jgi:hypothetical protein